MCMNKVCEIKFKPCFLNLACILNYKDLCKYDKFQRWNYGKPRMNETLNRTLILLFTLFRLTCDQNRDDPESIKVRFIDRAHSLQHRLIEEGGSQYELYQEKHQNNILWILLSQNVKSIG